MNESQQRNSPASADIFAAVNNYFLLFFCGSCVLSSMYIQQLFFILGQYRIGIGVSAIFGILLPVFLLMRKFPTGVRHQIRLARPRTHRLILVIVATAAAVVLIDQIYVFSQRLSPVPADYADAIRDLKPGSPLELAITFAGLCVLVPVAEEVVFRGMIQQIFVRNMGPWIGVALAAGVFGAAHLNAHLLLSITAFGLFLSFVFNATRNLTYTIVAHALFNVTALVQLVLQDDVLAGNLPIYLQDLWIAIVALVIFIFLIAKIREGGPETEPPSESPIS